MTVGFIFFNALFISLSTEDKGTFMTDIILANIVCILKISPKRLYCALLTNLE